MNVWPLDLTNLNRIRWTFEYNNLTVSSLEIPEGPILDWGCSRGLTTYDLSTLLPRRKVVGIDIDSCCIDIAKRDYPGLEFHCIDGCDLKTILPGPYAAIFAMNNLSNSLDRGIIDEKQFKEIAKILKSCLVDDGVLVLGSEYIIVYQNNITILGRSREGDKPNQNLINRLVLEA